RAYRWCNPPRIGCVTMLPNCSTGRVQGASFPSERWVRTSLLIAGVFREDAPKVLFVNTIIWSVIRIASTRSSVQHGRFARRTEGVGRSRMPIAWTRALNTAPNARSLSRTIYFGAVSHGNASVIWRANHSAVGLRVTQTTTTAGVCGREQDMQRAAETQSSEPRTDQATQCPRHDCG